MPYITNSSLKLKKAHSFKDLPDILPFIRKGLNIEAGEKDPVLKHL